MRERRGCDDMIGSCATAFLTRNHGRQATIMHICMCVYMKMSRPETHEVGLRVGERGL